MPELTPNYKFKKPIFQEDTADIRVINENFDIADDEIKKANDSIEDLESNKQNKEDSTLKTVVKTIVGSINELYDELIKKATKTQLGRIKVGNNLTIDGDGTLHGNPEYTHPSGNGNNHIPVNGASGNFLKWVSSGAAQWVNITWSDITGKPSTFPPSTHTHDYAASSHTHDDRYYTESEIDTKFKNFCPFKVGDIYLTTNSTNPSSLFLGTTWQKIEGRFLLGTSGSGASKQTGGSMTKTIAKANLPNIKLEIDPITESMQVSRLSQVRRSESTNMANSSVEIPLNGESKAFTSGGTGGANWNWTYFKSLQETKSFSSSPQTSDLGSGQALDITPSYYTTHMWLRTS